MFKSFLAGPTGAPGMGGGPGSHLDSSYADCREGSLPPRGLTSHLTCLPRDDSPGRGRSSGANRVTGRYHVQVPQCLVPQKVCYPHPGQRVCVWMGYGCFPLPNMSPSSLCFSDFSLSLAFLSLSVTPIAPKSTC